MKYIGLTTVYLINMALIQSRVRYSINLCTSLWLLRLHALVQGSLRGLVISLSNGSNMNIAGILFIKTSKGSNELLKVAAIFSERLYTKVGKEGRLSDSISQHHNIEYLHK